MTRKYSEGRVGEALRAMDLETLVFKLQDFAGPSQNRKPADFIVWWRPEQDVVSVAAYDLASSVTALREMGDYALSLARSALVEVKENPNVGSFPLSELTPSQALAMRRAVEIGLSYWLAVYWPKLRAWTLTNGVRLVARIDAGAAPLYRREFLADCAPGQLASTLRMALLGELDG